MEYIDLTHTINQDILVFPGDPIPEIKHVMFINKDGYNDFQIKIGMHVGTHIDAPLHMFQNGKRLSDYSPDRFFGKGHLIELKGPNNGIELLEGKNISRGDIVFLMTGFYKKFGTAEYYDNYPEISEAFAKKIIELDVGIIGLDTPGPDRQPYNIHKLLLENDILIIENLTNLELLSGHKQFEIAALPAKFETDAAPVRVVARIP